MEHFKITVLKLQSQFIGTLLEAESLTILTHHKNSKQKFDSFWANMIANRLRRFVLRNNVRNALKNWLKVCFLIQ